MRKVQLILGFLLFCSQIWGQGFERSFSVNNGEWISDCDSLGPDLWKLTFSYYHGGSGPNYGIVSQAIYDKSSNSLGPTKIVERLHQDNRYRLPRLNISRYKGVSLDLYDAYPFLNASWIDFRDTGQQKFVDIPRMAVSFNWQYCRDTVFGLFNALGYQDWSDNRLGNDTFFLCRMITNSPNFEVLDTFKLELDLKSPGTFLMAADARSFEYINDSLHYHYRRGKPQADTFYVDTNAFYGKPKARNQYNAHFSKNHRLNLNYLLGKF
jgi:hypothetical protein